MKHKLPVLMRPLGRITGEMELAVEKGSKEVNAAPRPAILPFVNFGGAAVRVMAGLVFWLTRADQDFGGGRGVAGF